MASRIGGDRLVILNQEVRFPIYRWVNGVVFADAGNIFDEGRDDVAGANSRWASALAYGSIRRWV